MYDRFLRKFITVIDRNKRGVSTKDAVVRSLYHVPIQSKRNSSRDLLNHMIMRVFTSLFFVIYHSIDLFFFLATVLSGS